MSSSKLRLVWDSWNREHIRKHNVSVSEANQAFDNRVDISKSYLGRKVVLGMTKKGRLITLVLSFEKQKDAYPVSARDMSSKERKMYYEKAKANE